MKHDEVQKLLAVYQDHIAHIPLIYGELCARTKLNTGMDIKDTEPTIFMNNEWNIIKSIRKLILKEPERDEFVDNLPNSTLDLARTLAIHVGLYAAEWLGNMQRKYDEGTNILLAAEMAVILIQDLSGSMESILDIADPDTIIDTEVHVVQVRKARENLENKMVELAEKMTKVWQH